MRHTACGHMHAGLIRNHMDSHVWFWVMLWVRSSYESHGWSYLVISHFYRSGLVTKHMTWIIMSGSVSHVGQVWLWITSMVMSGYETQHRSLWSGYESHGLGSGLFINHMGVYVWFGFRLWVRSGYESHDDDMFSQVWLRITWWWHGQSGLVMNHMMMTCSVRSGYESHDDDMVSQVYLWITWMFMFGY